jgi:membrane protein DedA with SNARE-associated domain
MGPGRRTTLLRVLTLLAVIAIVIFVYSLRGRTEQLAAYGYPGVFLIALLANATVVLPAPGVAVVFAMGGVLNPLWVALAAATGAALGELTGYLAGFSGQGLVENSARYERIAPWVNRYGALAIFFFAALPNPFFDVAGVAAGMLRLPLRKFLPACWAGQTVKMLAFAYAGAGSLAWLQRYLNP